MSRKRSSDNTSSTEITTPLSPESPAEVTAEPFPSPTSESTTATTEAPTTDDSEDRRFAERIGQKQRVTIPDPFGIATDNLAGVRLFESRRDRQMAIKFGDGSLDAKPSQAVIDRLKEAGYRWQPANKVWTYPLHPDSAMSTRIEAEQLYQEVCQMIRQEKGIEAGKGVPF